jgi:hypothetical protein
MERLRATAVFHLVAAMTCLFGPAAYAGFSYDFETQPPTTFINSSAQFNGAPSSTFSSNVSGGVLHLSDGMHPNSGGAWLGTAVETSQLFTDLRATATLNPAGATNNTLNVTVRYSPSTGTSYAVGLDFQTGRLVVGKIYGRVPAEFAFSTDPGQGSQRLLTDLARSYFLQVDAIGNNVTASLFDSPGGPQLLKVNYRDTGVGGAPFTSGMSGLSAVSFDGTTAVLLDGTFDNFSSTAFPEPGAATAGAIFGLTALRRRHARGPVRPA